MPLSLSDAVCCAAGIDRGNFLRHGMETGGGKAKRKSISGQLLQDSSAVSFVSKGLALEENERACASPRDAGEVRSAGMSL